MGTTTAVLAELWLTRFVPDLTNRTPISALRPYLPLLCRPISSPPLSAGAASLSSFRLRFRNPKPQRVRRNLTSTPVASMFSENPVVGDIFAAVFSGGVALSLLRLWGETAKRGLFDQTLNRKLVHVSVGLVFMLCWPLFSSGHQGAVIASLIPGLNIIKMLLIGLGIWKDEATVKSMSRFGDYRELLKGPLYYAATITLSCAIYWRSSPIAIAAICNLCAGDGIADIVGRRFGIQKIPYNRNKTIAGSCTIFHCSDMFKKVGKCVWVSWLCLSQQHWLNPTLKALSSMTISQFPLLPCWWAVLSSDFKQIYSDVSANSSWVMYRFFILGICINVSAFLLGNLYSFSSTNCTSSRTK